MNRYQMLSAIFLALLVGSCATAPVTTTTRGYDNPILRSESLADPHVIRHDGKYYMYGTYLDGSLEGGSDHYDVFVSDDLRDWTKVPDIFSLDSRTLWAPDVFYDKASETFYLYYSNEMNIGVAIADSPTGPFVDKGILIEHAIDAHMYEEDGRYYLYYSSSVHNADTDAVDLVFDLLSDNKGVENILVQPMSSPVTKAGEPILLLEPTLAWEKGFLIDVNEGAWMYKHGGLYYLMYSGNETMFAGYAIGYAVSDSPTGPFRKYKGNPIVASDFLGGIHSPGHHSVVRDDAGQDWIIYHQKTSHFSVGFSQRYICRDKLSVKGRGLLQVDATPIRPELLRLGDR